MSKKTSYGECESCGFKTTVALYGPNPATKQSHWLCHLCSSTFAGNAVDYPMQYPNADVLRSMCYIGNVILDAIKRTSESQKGSIDAKEARPTPD